MASGPVNRIKRPNTWLHRPMLQNVKKALAKGQERQGYQGRRYQGQGRQGRRAQGGHQAGAVDRDGFGQRRNHRRALQGAGLAAAHASRGDLPAADQAEAYRVDGGTSYRIGA